MNDYEFSKSGLKAEQISGYDDRFLLTESHLGMATTALKEAVTIMEAIDLEKTDLNSVYNFAAKVSTVAKRIGKIQLHEQLIHMMSEHLLEKMVYGSWYTKRDIKMFLGSNWKNSEYYEYRRDSSKDPWHHIDVLLERLVINGTLKSITKDGTTYYSSVATDF